LVNQTKFSPPNIIYMIGSSTLLSINLLLISHLNCLEVRKLYKSTTVLLVHSKQTVLLVHSNKTKNIKSIKIFSYFAMLKSFNTYLIFFARIFALSKQNSCLYRGAQARPNKKVKNVCKLIFIELFHIIFVVKPVMFIFHIIASYKQYVHSYIHTRSLFVLFPTGFD